MQQNKFCALHDRTYSNWCPSCSSSNYEIIFKVASEEIIKFLQGDRAPHFPLDNIVPYCMKLPAVQTYLKASGGPADNSLDLKYKNLRIRELISDWIKTYIELPDNISKERYGFRASTIYKGESGNEYL